MTDPSRHDKRIAAAVWLAGQGALISWASVDQGKDVKRKWKSDMTDDPAEIAKFLRWPKVNPLVIPTGRLVIPDCDAYGGYDRLVAAGLPDTFRVQTPTVRKVADGKPLAPEDDPAQPTYHGVHPYVLAPDGYDVTSIPNTWADGEIRRSDHGEQSMVLGPWAITKSGIYTPVDDAPRRLAVASVEFLDYLKTNPAQNPGPSQTNGHDVDDDWPWDPATMGSRHEHLLKTIRAWRGIDADADSLKRRTVDYIERHHIPLDRPGGESIDDAEIDRMIKGALDKFDDDQPGQTGGVVIHLKGKDDEDDDINAAVGDASTPEIVLPTEFSLDMFRGPIGEFAIDTGWKATLASPISLLVTGLAGFGSLVGRAAWYRWGDGYGYATTFPALIGPTGQGAKGISRRVTDRYLKAIPGYKVLSHLSSGEGFVKAVAGLTPDPVIEDRRVVVITEEIAMLLRAKDRPDNTLGQYLIEAYDGIDLGRHLAREQLIAENPAVSIVGHITPEVLLAELNDIDIANGFINRFLLLPSMSRWSDTLVGHPDKVYEDLTKLLAQRLVTIRDKANVGPMWFTPEAYALLQACDRWQFNESILIRPLAVAQLLQRLSQNTWRLSVVYALTEGRREVGVGDVRAALALTDLSERTVRALFSVSQPLTDDERTVLNWMTNKGAASYTAFEITHGAVSSRYRDRSQRSLIGLVAKGRIESTKAGRGYRFSVIAGGRAPGRTMREAVLP